MAEAIEFLNLAQFEARALAALAGLREEGMVRLEHTGEKVAEIARQLAPVGSGEEDTPGELRDSIASQREGDSVEVGSFGTSYASYVELGTSKMAPRPFLRPALAQAHKEL